MKKANPVYINKLFPRGTKRLKKRLNKKRLNRELRQSELPGVTPQLKAALKKFRKDGEQAYRDWFKPIRTTQKTLDQFFYPLRITPDTKQARTETEGPGSQDDSVSTITDFLEFESVSSADQTQK